MIDQIDHIGIAVRSLEAAAPLYRDILGLALEGTDEVPEQGVKVAFYRAGEVLIELLEPTREDSPIARFLEKRGEGVHHIALRTGDIEAGRDRVARASIRLLSDKPLDGAHGKLISFMHPKDTMGVLMELTQRKQH
jgi:methylmalonyl-CoA/ethylmalonyl-CoA epimerase